MSLESISPEAARVLLEQGAVLVDTRSAADHARERIPASRHIAMEALAEGASGIENGQVVIFHCRSGHRTRLNAAMLEGCTDGEAYLLEGGLDAWKKAGLPVLADHTQPIELQRQVQIAAGSMVVLGAVLGATVSPWFYMIPAFIGLGLVFAGLSGFCGLARVLMKMPWNRRALVAAGGPTTSPPGYRREG